MFQDYDFLSIPRFLTTSAEPNTLSDIMGVDIDEYIELMPEDIRRRYSENCLQQEKSISKSEQIINSFLNAIREIELHPTLYKNHTEPQINDIIASFVKQFLTLINVAVTRETPCGYALKDTGEVDFFLFESSSGNNIAIEESKDAGQFSKTIRQLLGYMNRDTQFGFTISINKTNTVDEAKKQIIKELEKFKEITEFKTIKIIRNNDYIMSLHIMPEDNTKNILLYHLVLNFNTDARKDITKQARKK